jgi:hypothetical protein
MKNMSRDRLRVSRPGHNGIDLHEETQVPAPTVELRIDSVPTLDLWGE